VVLLHGFPEFWYSWRHQIPALVGAGFRVIALDQRGYNTSDKPAGVAPYRIDNLVEDIRQLILFAGEKKAVVVGHDWGGAVAWTFAMKHPERVRRLIVMNAPHPRRVFQEFRTIRQLARSWYVFFFQLPWLPEWLISRGRYRSIRIVLSRDLVYSGAFSAEDIAAYQAAIARPGALTAAINYYRALFQISWLRLYRDQRPIEVPTLLIWGERDRYLGIRFTEGLSPWVSDLTVVRIPNASHWVQVDVPERVNASMLEFLGGPM
jgi:pimeloyl-ACP methyl ester carboxylesterase